MQALSTPEFLQTRGKPFIPKKILITPKMHFSPLRTDKIETGKRKRTASSGPFLLQATNSHKPNR
jgi:hypothetical protein